MKVKKSGTKPDKEGLVGFGTGWVEQVGQVGKWARLVAG
jgi:hypothetical protein